MRPHHRPYPWSILLITTPYDRPYPLSVIRITHLVIDSKKKTGLTGLFVVKGNRQVGCTVVRSPTIYLTSSMCVAYVLKIENESAG